MRGSDPTLEERALLALLVKGLADDDARAKLGLSRRTFERRLRSAFDKLGARSRLQAGFLVARAGWLDEQHRARRTDEQVSTQPGESTREL